MNARHRCGAAMLGVGIVIAISCSARSDGLISASQARGNSESFAGQLPQAAVYFSLHLDEVLTRLIVPVKAQLPMEELSRALGGDGPPGAVLASLGVDTSRALLGSVAPASEKNALSIVDAMAAGATNEKLAALMQAHAKEATRMRLLVPLVKGADASRVVEALGRALGDGVGVSRCPGTTACAAFTSTVPLGVAQGPRTAAAAYSDGADLRVDIVHPLFVAGTDPSALAALAAMHDARGGFEGRCSTLDVSASASFCFDPGPAGELGATLGYSEMIDYSRMEAFANNTAMRTDMAVRGRPLSHDSLWLAAPTRRLAADGTVSFLAKTGSPSVLASWALTDASKSAVAAAFAAERCASGRAIPEELLLPLRAAFGDPGEDFAGPETGGRFAAAHGRLLGALSGTWPNLLDMVLAAPREELPILPEALKACLRHEDGRLVLVVKQGP